jgi:hypothetical protein
MVAQLFGAGVARAGTAVDVLVLGAAGLAAVGFAAPFREAGGGSATGLAVSSNGAGRAGALEANDAGRSGGGSGTAGEVTERADPATGALAIPVEVRIAVEVLAGLGGTTGVAGGSPESGISTRISFPQEQR